ncbi:MAG TPA: DUF6011 domain-containing protein [Arthrobacter sp.]
MPENPTPNMVTQPQLTFLRTLAHRVTGDGGAHVAALTANDAPALTAAAASAEIKRLKAVLAAEEAKRPAAPPRKEAVTMNAPAGRYSVDLPSGPLLVEVTKPTSGNWAGYTFVKTVPVLAELAPEPVKGALAVAVLKAIDENPRGCAGMYGRITGKCGQCNRGLSGPASVSLGIGPECLGKFDDTAQRGLATPFRRATGPQAPERF